MDVMDVKDIMDAMDAMGVMDLEGLGTDPEQGIGDDRTDGCPRYCHSGGEAASMMAASEVHQGRSKRGQESRARDHSMNEVESKRGRGTRWRGPEA